MKTRRRPRRVSAFTLLELLLVLLVMAILLSLLLPALERGRVRARRIECVNHLRQVGIAFHLFAHDHTDLFPMRVSTNHGGTLEFVQAMQRVSGDFYFAFRHVQALSNELVLPKLLVCPSDPRRPAASFDALRNEHLSYFNNVRAQFPNHDSILGGDRNLASDHGSAVLDITPGDTLHWTAELHRSEGNVLFADARVEQLTGHGLTTAFRNAPGGGIVWPPVTPPSVAAVPGARRGAEPAAPPAAGGGLPLLDEILPPDPGAASGFRSHSRTVTNTNSVVVSSTKVLVSEPRVMVASDNRTTVFVLPTGPPTNPVGAVAAVPPNLRPAPDAPAVPPNPAPAPPASVDSLPSSDPLPVDAPLAAATELGARWRWLLWWLLGGVLFTLEWQRRRRARHHLNTNRPGA